MSRHSRNCCVDSPWRNDLLRADREQTVFPAAIKSNKRKRWKTMKRNVLIAICASAMLLTAIVSTHRSARMRLNMFMRILLCTPFSLM